MDFVIELVLTIIFDVVLGGRMDRRGRRSRRRGRSSPLAVILLLMIFMCFCLCAFLIFAGMATTGNTILTQAR